MHVSGNMSKQDGLTTPTSSFYVLANTKLSHSFMHSTRLSAFPCIPKWHAVIEVEDSMNYLTNSMSPKIVSRINESGGSLVRKECE